MLRRAAKIISNIIWDGGGGAAVAEEEEEEDNDDRIKAKRFSFRFRINNLLCNYFSPRWVSAARIA